MTLSLMTFHHQDQGARVSVAVSGGRGGSGGGSSSSRGGGNGGSGGGGGVDASGNTGCRQRLAVRKSLLAGAGDGLFAVCAFEKGEVICSYASPSVTWLLFHLICFSSTLSYASRCVDWLLLRVSRTSIFEDSFFQMFSSTLGLEIRNSFQIIC